MKKPIRPVRNIKSIKDVYLKHFWWQGDKEKAIESTETDKWLCHSCKGYGKVKDTSTYDPVEGIKYNDMIMCDICMGSGSVSKNFYREKYHQQNEAYKKSLEKYNKDLEIYKSIKSKLTKEELKWMNIE